MKQISIKKSNLWSLLIMFTVGMMLMFLGMAAVGNQPETYNDFIVETVAQQGTNESGELGVFWGLLLAGIPAGLGLNYWLKKRLNRDDDKELKDVAGIELVINGMNLIFMLVFGEFVFGLVGLAIVVFLNHLINKRRTKEGLILTLLLYYAALGLATAVNFVGINLHFDTKLLMIVAGAADLIVMAVDRKHEILNKAILLAQVLIPANLLLYACERYIVNGEVVKMGLPTLARALIAAGIIGMVVYAGVKLVKNWKVKDLPLNKILLLPTIILIFVVNSVATNTSIVVPEDMHHTAEEVISYQQIVGKGQGVYTDYSPVSGLFPVLIGGVLEMFGGDITYFNLAHTTFMAIMAAITIFVASRHLDREDALILAVCFMFPSYDRAVWISLSLLILMLPKLIKRRNLWLKTWLWLSFIGGIYYPSFGGAVMLGTLPFAIVQVVGMVKDGELKKLLKNWKFYFWWAVCLAPIVACVPMLINMAKHVALYSSQTTLADGISVFGQPIMETFMRYLGTDGDLLNYVRAAFYYGFRYVLPMLVIWLLVLILAGQVKKRNWKKFVRSPEFLALSASILTIIVGYTGTMVRSDSGRILSRAIYVIVPVFGIVFYVFLKKYVKPTVPAQIVMILCLGTTLILGCSPVTAQDGRLRYAYDLEDKYIEIPQEMQESYPRLGHGFIQKEVVEDFEDYRERAQALLEIDPDLKFYAWGKLGTYYILDLTTVGQPSTYAAKDYKTHGEIIEAIKAQRPVIGLDISSTVLDYYLYNWILREDSYVYDKNYKAFLPVELFEKIYGAEAKPTDKSLVPWRRTDVGRVSDSLGGSLETLEKIMTKQDVGVKIIGEELDEENHTYTYTLKFDRDVAGIENDMLYLDFAVDGYIYDPGTSRIVRTLSKQHVNDGIYVTASWGGSEQEQMLSIMGSGDLLVPIGANVTWLLNDHDELTITIKNVDKKIELNNVQFYELRKEQ